MTKTIYLVCGVSGSGKTWVCTQLTDKFTYVPHDEHYARIANALFKASLTSPKPLITEVPFGERPLREVLETRGFKVIPVFVVETPEIVKERYSKRENKPAQAAVLTRSTSIMRRVVEWRAPYGTSNEILKYLREVDT